SEVEMLLPVVGGNVLGEPAEADGGDAEGRHQTDERDDRTDRQTEATGDSRQRTMTEPRHPIIVADRRPSTPIAHIRQSQPRQTCGGLRCGRALALAARLRRRSSRSFLDGTDRARAAAPTRPGTRSRLVPTGLRDDAATP